MGKVSSVEIKRALAQYHSDPRKSTIFFEVKNGPTWTARRGELLILDGLAIKKSWTKPCFTGYEIKVSRSDFLQDDKWPGYLDYCHKFYFVCPKGMISRKEIEALDENVGLMYYDPDYENCGLHTMKAPVLRNTKIPSAEMLYYIIMSKLEPDRYPFYSEKKKYFKKWLEEKKDNYNFGMEVQGRIGDVICDQEKELKNLRRKLKRFECDEDIITSIIDYLKNKGLLIGWGKKELKDDWKEQLEKILGSSFASHEKYKIKKVIEASEELKDIIGYQEQ